MYMDTEETRQPEGIRKITSQFARYSLVAGAGYIVDVGVLYALHEYFQVYYLYAAITSFVLGLVIVYILSSLFVFTDSKIESKYLEIGIFSLIGVVGLIILTVLMWALTSFLGINYLIAKVLATVVVYAWNFFARRIMYND